MNFRGFHLFFLIHTPAPHLSANGSVRTFREPIDKLYLTLNYTWKDELAPEPAVKILSPFWSLAKSIEWKHCCWSAARSSRFPLRELESLSGEKGSKKKKKKIKTVCCSFLTSVSPCTGVDVKGLSSWGSVTMHLYHLAGLLYSSHADIVAPAWQGCPIATTTLANFQAMGR